MISALPSACLIQMCLFLFVSPEKNKIVSQIKFLLNPLSPLKHQGIEYKNWHLKLMLDTSELKMWRLASKSIRHIFIKQKCTWGNLGWLYLCRRWHANYYTLCKTQEHVHSVPNDAMVLTFFTNFANKVNAGKTVILYWMPY